MTLGHNEKFIFTGIFYGAQNIKTCPDYPRCNFNRERVYLVVAVEVCYFNNTKG